MLTTDSHRLSSRMHHITNDAPIPGAGRGPMATTNVLMLDTDKIIYDPIKRFVDRLDDKLPDRRVLRSAANGDVVKDAERWVAEFQPAAGKAERLSASQRELDAQELVLEETHHLVS